MQVLGKMGDYKEEGLPKVSFYRKRPNNQGLQGQLCKTVSRVEGSRVMGVSTSQGGVDPSLFTHQQESPVESKCCY